MTIAPISTAAAPGNADRQHRNEAAHSRGVVLPFERRDRFDGTLAEKLRLSRNRFLDGMGDELADIAAQARQCAEDEADRKAIGDGGQRVLIVLPTRKDVLQLYGALLDRGLDRPLQRLDHFRQSKQADAGGDEIYARLERPNAEMKPRLGAQWLKTDGGEHEAKRADCEPFQHDAAAERRDQGKDSENQHCFLGRAEAERQPAQRNRKQHQADNGGSSGDEG
jgi:hypothetical protein